MTVGTNSAYARRTSRTPESRARKCASSRGRRALEVVLYGSAQKDAAVKERAGESDDEGEVGEDLNSEEALRKRHALRQLPQVKSVLRAWWALADAGCSGVIGREEYINLQRKVYVAMCAEGGEYDAAEAQKYAERDWMNDSCDGKPLNRIQFENALFELADVNTDTIDEEE